VTEIDECIELLRKAATDWSDPNQLDADLRGMHGVVESLASRLLDIASRLEETGVHSKYPEAAKEAAAGLAAIADELGAVTGGGVMSCAPAGGISAIAGRLAGIVDRLGTLPDAPKTNIAKPWVPGPAPLPGTPRHLPKHWRAPERDTRSKTPDHRLAPAGHFPPGYGLRPPPPPLISRREARKRARRAWRKLSS
jgi:hypothetical protein